MLYYTIVFFVIPIIRTHTTAYGRIFGNANYANAYERIRSHFWECELCERIFWDRDKDKDKDKDKEKDKDKDKECCEICRFRFRYAGA